MINRVRSAVGSSTGHSPQVRGPNASRTSTSGSPAALGQAGSKHRCRGFGRDTGRCMATIPIERDLCQYCVRSSLLVERLKTQGAVQCPSCLGDITEDGHYLTRRHVNSVPANDRRLIEEIKSKG